MQQPSLTVVVTSYNYSNYISRCIESILEQDYSDFELIVLDNCSTDETVEVVSRFLSDERVRLVRHSENIGACLNFNAALRVGNGRYLSLVSADDCLLPGHFSRLMSALKRNVSCVLAYSPVVIMDSCGVLHGAQRHSGYAEVAYCGGRDEFSDLLVHDCYVTLCAAIFDRDQISGDLYFDIEAWGGADWELFVRLAAKYKNFAFDPLPGSCYRIHDKQYSRNNFYSSLEPLYTHIYIVEKYLGKILAECEGAAGRIADHLRKRAGQYGNFHHARLQQRLDNALLKLEHGVSDLESDTDSFLNVIVGSGERGGNVKALLSGLSSSFFLDVDDVEVAVSVNERVAFSSCDFVLLVGVHGFPCCEDVLNARDFLDKHPSIGAVSFVFSESGMENASINQENAIQVSSVFCRRSVFEKAGGYNPSLVLGERVWDFTLKLLREGQRIQSQVIATRMLGSSAYNSLDWASIVFRNTLHFDVSDIVRAATSLLDNKKIWLRKIERVLRCEPSCGSAYFFDLLAKCRADQGESSPIFSVVLTTYNRPELLRDALASVGRQSLKDFELILVNDNGVAVESLLADYDFPITYVRQGRNQGPAAARNAALRLARGQYVVFLDDDDLYLPNHLQELAAALEAHPDSVVYTDAVFVLEKIETGKRIELGREQRYPHDEYSRDGLLVNNYIPINTFACPRALALEVGDFDESLAGLEDWDFLMRLCARRSFHHIQCETVEVRMRQESSAPERRSQQALKDYPALYRELYSRHSDLGQETIRRRRQQFLERLGASPTELPEFSLKRWLTERLPTPVESRLIADYLDRHQGGPLIGVVVLDSEGRSEQLMVTLKSLIGERCLYARLRILVLTTADVPATSVADKLHYLRLSDESLVLQINRAVEASYCQWFMLARAGDEFTQSGLMIAGLELAANPDCRAVYGDQLQRLPDGSLGGVFLPGFNLDLLLSFPLVMARHWLYRRDLFLAVGGFDREYPEAFEFELLTRLIEQEGLSGLGHIDEPLLITEAPSLCDNSDERRVIERHLQSRGYQAQVAPGLAARYRIKYGHTIRPQVSIIISTDVPLAALQRCSESLLEKTIYAHYELLLVDTGTRSDVSAWLHDVAALNDEKVRVLLSGSGLPQNLAAQQARGDYLLFLSGESAIVNPDWLDELLNHALRPEVGVVGAKLLTPSGRIAQAGLLLGVDGISTPAFAGEPMEAAGYFNRLQVDQNYSAVSAACLMIRTAIFAEAGGFDEKTSSFSDVDLCLKVGQQGYLVVWTPHAVVMHESGISQKELESVDQEAKRKTCLAEQDTVYEKWLPQLAHDPAYNGNLALNGGGFLLELNAGLTWRPLSWRPLPVVLAHNADPWGCGNYRIIKPFEALRAEGLVDGALSERLLSQPELARFSPDAIVFQRQTNPAALELMASTKRFSPAFKIYELDDYLPNTPMKSVHRASMSKDLVKLLRQGLSFVDRFVVSTQALADEFKGYHSRIHVVENRLPLDWWGNLALSVNDGTRPRVGWAGGVGHQGDLEMIADVVRDLASEVDWVFFGMCPDKLRPFVAEFHPGVDISSYPQFLANLRLDLAIAPLEDNIFNACKSNLRLLEYGICGFPVIASDIFSYRGSLPVALVKNRYRDWVEAIRCALAERNELRADGQRLQAAVKREWMLSGDNLKLWQRAWLPD